MTFNLIEVLKQKVENVEQQMKQRSEHLGGLSQSIDKMSSERVESHAHLHLLSGALQAYQDVMKIFDGVCNPVQAVADVVSEVAEIVSDASDEASDGNGDISG